VKARPHFWQAISAGGSETLNSPGAPASSALQCVQWNSRFQNLKPPMAITVRLWLSS